MTEHLTAKAIPRKGGVFIWAKDWEAIKKRLEHLDKENRSMRRMLHDTDAIRQSEIGGR